MTPFGAGNKLLRDHLQKKRGEGEAMGAVEGPPLAVSPAAPPRAAALLSAV